MKIKKQRPPWMKKAKRGFRGYPIATVAAYGPNDRKATKLVVGIVAAEDEETSDMRKWYSEVPDVRYSKVVQDEVRQFIKDSGAKTVGAFDRIIGCPHEEGPDYPVGEHCPECPFWKNRDRFTGELLNDDGS